MTDELAGLIEQLKMVGKEPDATLMDQIRALGTAAIEPLMAVAVDPELNEAETESAEVWTPIHAIQNLVDLELDADRITRLLHQVEAYPDDDWLSETLIEAMPRLGERAIDPCMAVWRDRTRTEHTRNVGASILETVAKEHSDLRGRIGAEIMQALAALDPDLETDADWGPNAFLLMALAETRLESAVPIIRQMFEQKRVDEMISGLDWLLATVAGLDPMEQYRGQRATGRFDFRRFLAARPPAPLPPYPGWDLPPAPPHIETYIAPKRPGRNEPCWCGSGKKYKKCHLKEDEMNDRNARSL